MDADSDLDSEGDYKNALPSEVTDHAELADMPRELHRPGRRRAPAQPPRGGCRRHLAHPESCTGHGMRIPTATPARREPGRRRRTPLSGSERR